MRAGTRGGATDRARGRSYNFTVSWPRRPRRRPPFRRNPPCPALPANRVRIIGGAWRGRVVRFPAVPGLRPTPDRVRETLFNWLGQELTGRRCLDCSPAPACCRSKRCRAARRWRWRSTAAAALVRRAARHGGDARREGLEAHCARRQRVPRRRAPRLRRDLPRSAVSATIRGRGCCPPARRASRPAASCTPRRAARSSRRRLLAAVAQRQGGAGALSSFRTGGRRIRHQASRLPTAHAVRHAQRRLPRHVRSVHPRPRGPRAPRGAAVRPGGRRRRRQRVEAAVLHDGRARRDGARGARAVRQRRGRRRSRRCSWISCTRRARR